MSKPELKLDWCSHAAAKFAVENWHYSRTMPKSKLAKIGVWEDGVFVGCVIFGVGATPNVTACHGLKNTEMCELVRVALTRHVSPVSRIVSIAFKLLRTHSPGIKMVVSYADPEESHHGGIYQAGNWIFVGQSQGDRKILVNGEWKHRRAVGHSGTSSIKGRISRKTLGKYKYLYPFDVLTRALIEPLAKPYPKRVTSIGSDATGFQSGKGGAIPTVTLQK